MAAGVIPSRSAVLTSFSEGVAGVEHAAAAIQDWDGPTPCTDWSARDLAGHLVAITRYFHDLLDDAESGRPQSGLPLGAELARMNARDLAARPDASGPSRIGEFAIGARSYLDRVKAADWNLVLGEWDAVGPLTLGQHTGLATGEWHLHAWDLAQVAGRDHRPSDAATVAAAHQVLVAQMPDGEPWEATLAFSGRV